MALLDDAMKAWISETSARDNNREERLMEEEPVYSNSRRMRDEKLAKDDTRKFCLDRCLATGCARAPPPRAFRASALAERPPASPPPHRWCPPPRTDCDALEDLLEMSTMEVKRFCDSCTHDDECLLPEYA